MLYLNSYEITYKIFRRRGCEKKMIIFTHFCFHIISIAESSFSNMSLILRISTNRCRILREERILDALTLALTDQMISIAEERVLWKSLTYLMNDKMRVKKLKFILDKKFGSVREMELMAIMLRYFKRIDNLNRMRKVCQDISERIYKLNRMRVFLGRETKLSCTILYLNIFKTIKKFINQFICVTSFASIRQYIKKFIIN